MIDARKWIWIPIACLLAGLLIGTAAQHVGCTPRPDVPVVVEPVKPKPDAVVYVYEKDDTAPSIEIMVLLDKLNRAGIQATDVDDDVVDGDGQTPDQYKAAIDAARLAGLPAIVLLSKGKFLDYADLADLEAMTK
jgi:hypothetical protein